MPFLEWRETARADLLAIVDYISDDNPDAAQRLKDDIAIYQRFPCPPYPYISNLITRSSPETVAECLDFASLIVA